MYAILFIEIITCLYRVDMVILICCVENRHILTNNTYKIKLSLLF